MQPQSSRNNPRSPKRKRRCPASLKPIPANILHRPINQQLPPQPMLGIQINLRIAIQLELISRVVILPPTSPQSHAKHAERLLLKPSLHRSAVPRNLRRPLPHQRRISLKLRHRRNRKLVPTGQHQKRSRLDLCLGSNSLTRQLPQILSHQSLRSSRRTQSNRSHRPIHLCPEITRPHRPQPRKVHQPAKLKPGSSLRPQIRIRQSNLLSNLSSPIKLIQTRPTKRTKRRTTQRNALPNLLHHTKPRIEHRLRNIRQHRIHSRPNLLRVEGIKPISARRKSDRPGRRLPKRLAINSRPTLPSTRTHSRLQNSIAHTRFVISPASIQNIAPRNQRQIPIAPCPLHSAANLLRRNSLQIRQLLRNSSRSNRREALPIVLLRPIQPQASSAQHRPTNNLLRQHTSRCA